MGATGTTTVDFGSTAPDGNDTTVLKTITGQGAIASGSLVEAWVRAETSADHNADEHMVEDLKVEAGNIVAGTGFDIRATCMTGKTYGVFNINWAWN
jgi:hypothetical protein